MAPQSRHHSWPVQGSLLLIVFTIGCHSTGSVNPGRADAFERARRKDATETPDLFNRIPDRLGDILVARHLYADGPVWGTARRTPDSRLEFDEMGSATFLGVVRQYDLFDRVGPLSDADRKAAISYWQSWQDPETGRFKDPRDPDRAVNEKYVVSLIHSLGGELLVPWTSTGMQKRVETDVFLRRTETDPDWAQGGWGVGSHTGLMAVEIYRAINDGQTELIPDLEVGMTRILSHQDPASGLWGAPEADPMRRIGGTLKVIGRFYFAMGIEVPCSRKLADTLIEYQRSGTWFEHGADSCVPRNVAEVTAYCLEISDYRREELLWVLESLADDYQSWVLPDGSLLMHRNNPETVGLQYTTIYGLGIIGGYLNWADCRLPNPLADSARGVGNRYQVVLAGDRTVRVVDTQPRG